MEFICDEKYENVIKELNRRGCLQVFETIENNNKIIPLNCKLIWKNLTKIKFQSIINRFVNHFKGSSHLSNKVCSLFYYFIRC